MSDNDWYRRLVDLGALWVHDSTAGMPHAELTAGEHSGVYVDGTVVTDTPALLEEAVHDLLQRAVAIGVDITCVDGVAGPQTGATKLARALSEQIAIRNGRPCFFVSPRNVVEKGLRSAEFSVPEQRLVNGAQILLCDDVYSTGGSVRRVASALTHYGGLAMDTVLVLVNRSGDAVHVRRQIVSLVERYVPTYLPHQCPLCYKGSRAKRPQKGSRTSFPFGAD